jgi:hypothetical protein
MTRKSVPTREPVISQNTYKCNARNVASHVFPNLKCYNVLHRTILNGVTLFTSPILKRYYHVATWTWYFARRYIFSDFTHFVFPLVPIRIKLSHHTAGSSSLITSALDGGEWSVSRPGLALPLGKEPLYPLDRSLGGPQSWSGHRG